MTDDPPPVSRDPHFEKLFNECLMKVKKIIESCASIATYFHQSGLHTKELKKIADENEMSLLHLPKYFDVHWTEFTYKLFYGLIKRWYILVYYFNKKKEEGIPSQRKIGSSWILKIFDRF